MSDKQIQYAVGSLNSKQNLINHSQFQQGMSHCTAEGVIDAQPKKQV